jgi:hypothetical protein
MTKKSKRRHGGADHEFMDVDFAPANGFSSSLPDGLPSYRLITGKDDAAFCQRVSDALKLGYHLYGSPAVTFNGTDVIAAQALLWSSFDDIPF